MARQRYLVMGQVGLFWDGPYVRIGCYRWLWLARLYARRWLSKWSYSQVTIRRFDL